MATIRKRGGKWQVQVRRMGVGACSRTFGLKDDAERWARQVEREYDRHGLSVDLKSLRSITVADLIVRYRDSVVIKKRSCDNETIMLNACLRQEWAQIPVGQVTAKIFSDYRDQRLQMCKPASVRRELGVLQHVFAVAIREWALPISHNPVAKIAMPSPGPNRDRRLMGDEEQRLFDAVRQCRNRFIRPLIELALETAMRRGELLNIHANDIRQDERTLHIPQTKNGHPRTIPLLQAPRADQALGAEQGIHAWQAVELRITSTHVGYTCSRTKQFPT
ncbi:MAG: tyrosine-type recombinase/integrase [Alphaproteobacteria bacterium]|nr:tyrosine-type recombinase/integrase [Alphaproteobacteria bacterium]